MKNISAVGWCPRTWDGWLCWEDAPPSTSQLASCPEFIALGSEPPSCSEFYSILLYNIAHWFTAIFTSFITK